MGINDKIKLAKPATWLTENLSESEIKSYVDLAKISVMIEHCRLERKMTQSEFAEYIGVSQGMVSKWESREYNFTIKSLNEICVKLDISFSILIEKSDLYLNYKVVSWSSDAIKNRQNKNEWIKDINENSMMGAIA